MTVAGTTNVRKLPTKFQRWRTRPIFPDVQEELEVHGILSIEIVVEPMFAYWIRYIWWAGSCAHQWSWLDSSASISSEYLAEVFPDRRWRSPRLPGSSSAGRHHIRLFEKWSSERGKSKTKTDSDVGANGRRGSGDDGRRKVESEVWSRLPVPRLL